MDFPVDFKVTLCQVLLALFLYSSNSRRKDLKRVRTNTQVSDMRVLHIDTFARLSAKAAHERQTFLRELRNLKKVPRIT